MGRALLTQELDRHNYASWKYEMHQSLVGQVYWNLVNPNYPMWQQGTSQEIYCLATYLQDHMLSYIRDVKAPKEAWQNLRKIFAAYTVEKHI